MSESISGPDSFVAAVQSRLQSGKRLRLFLDYDGTLVPIARTPAEAQPDAKLLDLLAAVGRRSTWQAVVLSGRPLASLMEMLPIPGLTLAGTYGLEIKQDDTILFRGGDLAQVQHVIRQVRDAWNELVAGLAGFLVEDKGVAVALHSRWAEPEAAKRIDAQARAAAQRLVPSTSTFRWLGGDRFFEVAPSAAHKGLTVEWFLDQPGDKTGLAICFGDDDKDEAAFGVIRRRGGVPVGVGTPRADSQALAWAATPLEARAWLRALVTAIPDTEA